ncbi:glycoside hydrolase family 43 protein [Annulohypoxylon truncatum]|uniref:glycoside hydrolase family 43 protein n=1 Tax=Annulohypoxylon truncatum TaxID=327061 RepID=UPI0020083AD8|nr:glycoside hydrolase family 43 protein [Annulohypoxylon truncatum]KAI1212036.1 glycoside hydrolase family 43 protein [Annulohypoxylon truncatum]
MSPPLITHLYTADPSAHVFDGKLYIYPSHDRETDIQFNDNGDQYDMVDYHVFSLDTLDAYASRPSPDPAPADPPKVTDHGVVLSARDVPWVSRQLWAPDAAYRKGKYYLYFPARDSDSVFRIGVAVGSSPVGPFTPDPDPIPGSFSIDPAAFVDDDADATAYLYFGGLWGGQLQCYQRGNDPSYFDAAWLGAKEPSGPGAKALCPKVAKMADDMRGFEGPVGDLVILDPETGDPIRADDHGRRFFEAAWMHKRGGMYYFSYSTGDTHFLVYAMGTSPLGPFTYAGRILEPVLGWTTHHSIVEFGGRWWLFYHDCELSGGVNHLRSVKVKEIFYDGEGKIVAERPGE